MAETKKKRPRGRPRTGQTPKRYFRMSSHEYDLVCDAAKKLGENTSEFTRRILLAKAKRILNSK